MKFSYYVSLYCDDFFLNQIPLTQKKQRIHVLYPLYLRQKGKKVEIQHHKTKSNVPLKKSAFLWEEGNLKLRFTVLPAKTPPPPFFPSTQGKKRFFSLPLVISLIFFSLLLSLSEESFKMEQIIVWERSLNTIFNPMLDPDVVQTVALEPCQGPRPFFVDLFRFVKHIQKRSQNMSQTPFTKTFFLNLIPTYVERLFQTHGIFFHDQTTPLGLVWLEKESEKETFQKLIKGRQEATLKIWAQAYWLRESQSNWKTAFNQMK